MDWNLDYRWLLDTLSDTVIASDASGLVRYANRSVERLLGWTPEALVGRPLTDLMPERFRPRHLAGFRRYIRTHQVKIMGKAIRVAALHRTGREVEIDLLLGAVPTDGGGELILGTLRDVREQVDLERRVGAQQRVLALTSTMGVLVQADRLEQAAPRLLEALCENLGWKMGVFWRVQGDALRLEHVWSMPGFEPSLWADSGPLRLRRGEGLAGEAWANRTPRWSADLQRESRLRLDAWEVSEEGLRAGLFFPVLGRARVHGVVGLLSDERAEPDADLLGLLGTFGLQVGQFLDRLEAEEARVRLLERERAARREAEHRAWREALSSNASAALSSSLDYHKTLERFGEVLVPALADFCEIYLVEGESQLPRPVVLTHVDPEKVRWAKSLAVRHPQDPHADSGPVAVIRSGKAELYPEITDASLKEAIRDPDYLAQLRGMGLRSGMCVPLIARGRTLGAVLLLATRPDVRYGHEDLSLARQIADRAALAVDNARLYLEAQQAVRIRDEFLSVASHELRTPLTPLQLQIHALRRRAHDLGDASADLALFERQLLLVERQSRRLGRLVNEMLDISRLSAGALQLELEPVDLGEEVRSVLAQLEDLGELSRSGSRVRLELSPDVVGRWDRLRVEQIVSNLLSNALKYGGGSPVRVRVREMGLQAQLTVADSGIGIAPEDRARIFGRFERASSDRHYGGLGLGLYIVRQVVMALGGTIRLRSRLGRGSVFRVRLPLEGPRRAPSEGRPVHSTDM